LKQVLTSFLVLAFLKIEGKFIFYTDASNQGIGNLITETRWCKKVIAYYSQVLNKAEKNYCITRCELLVVI